MRTTIKWQAGQLFFCPQSATRINRVHRVKGSRIWYLGNHYGANPPRGVLRQADAVEAASWVPVERNYSAPHSEQAKLHAHLVITARIECCICGESHEGEEHTQLDVGNVVPDATDYFFSIGWREKSSGKFQVIGAMCPTCAKSKDSDRNNE